MKWATTIPKQFLGAFKAGHRATSRDFIDEELSYKLLNRIIESNYADLDAIKALEFITKFNNEFHKNVIKKGDETALHAQDEMRRDCYNRQNSRQRCVMSFQNYKMRSLTPEAIIEVESVEAHIERHSTELNYKRHEDVLIDLIAASRQF